MITLEPVIRDSPNVEAIVRIIDSLDGSPETGVVAATAGLDLKYRREFSATANLTEADLTNLNDAHSDGGIKHIGAGYYRVDIPDAAVATGANHVIVFGTVTDMIVEGCYIPLVDSLTTTEIADAVLDEALSGHTTAGTLGEAINRTANKDGRLRSR